MTTPQPFLALAVLVAVIIDGALIPTAQPASLRAGHVVAPLALVARIADRIDGSGPSVTARRGERACVATTIPGSDPPLIELAPLARCLGASHVDWDRTSKTLAIVFGGPAFVRTPPPFDPQAPQVVPTTVFTPEPAPPTPRVIATGSPRPRRTAIPVLAPPPAPTSPRPRAL